MLTASILRELSRQHRYTLFLVQTPYLEATPGESLAQFRSLTRAKQANPANSLQSSLEKQAGRKPTCLDLDFLPRVIAALPAYSQLESLAEAMPGQSPVPFHPFPRVKQATPVCSPYTLLFGSQTGQTGVLP